MKILSIRMYQAISFRQKTITFLNVANPQTASLNPLDEVTLELIPNIGVKIEDKHSAVIVTFNNLSSIEVEKAQPVPKVKAAK